MRSTSGSRKETTAVQRYPCERRAGIWIASCPSPPRSAPIAIPTIGSNPNRGQSGAIRYPDAISAMLSMVGAMAGMKKTRRVLRNPMTAAEIETRTRNGVMIWVMSVVSSSLPGTSAKPGARIRTITGRGQDPDQADPGNHDEQEVDDQVGQAERGGGSIAFLNARQRRHERGAHRAFREQVPEQVGYAEGDLEGVDREAGAELGREDLLADQPEKAAQERGRRDHPRRAGYAFPARAGRYRGRRGCRGWLPGGLVVRRGHGAASSTAPMALSRDWAMAGSTRPGIGLRAFSGGPGFGIMEVWPGRRGSGPGRRFRGGAPHPWERHP